MKVYEVNIFEDCLLVLAKDEIQCKEFLSTYYNEDEIESIKECSFMQEILDVLHNKEEPKILNKNSRKLDSILRNAGWGCDGDSSCDRCGLYEMGDYKPLDENNLCEDCR